MGVGKGSGRQPAKGQVSVARCCCGLCLWSPSTAKRCFCSCWPSTSCREGSLWAPQHKRLAPIRSPKASLRATCSEHTRQSTAGRFWNQEGRNQV